MRHLTVPLLILLTLGACSDDSEAPVADAAIFTPDKDPKRCTGANGDYDGDGISDADEGCATGRDTDGDKIPDWQDFDSDGDKLPDSVEGPRGDSDGDKVPDALDADSDGDGLGDGVEDYNYDGLLGCCLSSCGKPDAAWQKGNCKLNKDGCGTGQKCVSSACVPAEAFLCSRGETDPTKKVTFSDGKNDSQRGHSICARESGSAMNPGTTDFPVKAVSLDKWRVAYPAAAAFTAYSIAGAKASEGAVALDFAGSSQGVAGFALSFTGSKATLTEELAALKAALAKAVTGTVVSQTSGLAGTAMGLYPAQQEVSLSITLTTASDAASVRDQLVAAMLGRKVSDLGTPPQAFSDKSPSFELRLALVRRFTPKTDSSNKRLLDLQGRWVDSGDKTRWRVNVIGGVARAIHQQDTKRDTGIIMSDLANASFLGLHGTGLKADCDTLVIKAVPSADFIWVIDESGSMNTLRKDMVNNARDFFTRALAAGLDFRMGVTGSVDPKGTSKAAFGKFCSKISSNKDDQGGVDRFLLPTEQSVFASCIKNPPGSGTADEFVLQSAKQAVAGHLPRVDNDPSMIRKDAALNIIVVTDEPFYDVANSKCCAGCPNCPINATCQAEVDKAVKPYLDYFMGQSDTEAKATVHFIGVTCASASAGSPCYQTQPGYSYMTLANKLGGLSLDICQKTWGAALGKIIDSMVGTASRLTLSRIPVSASLKVIMDGKPIKRSWVQGFDYRANDKALVLFNAGYKKGSELVVSYLQWSVLYF